MMRGLRQIAGGAPCVGVILLVLASLSPCFAQTVPTDPRDGLLARLDAELDRGNGASVLKIAERAVTEDDAPVVDVAALTTMLAPWMARDIVDTVLRAVPHSERERLAPTVLASVLVASHGRQAALVADAVLDAAPGADVAVIRRLATALSNGDVHSRLADTAGQGGDRTSRAVADALGPARTAVLRQRARLEAVRRTSLVSPQTPRDGLTLPPSGRGSVGPLDPVLDLPDLPVPRLPDPGDRPSPS